MPTTTPRLTAGEFAARADAMVGLPYILGAEWGPSLTAPKRPKALDCSELVEGLYRENNTPIGDLAASQFDRTKPVTGSPKVGDLVFLRNNPARWNGIGHVAVITAKLSNGDWRVIEARGRAAGTVKTTLSYWKTRRHYAGIRRFPGFSLRTGQPPSEPAVIDPRFRFGQANLRAAHFGGLPDKSPLRGKFLRDQLRCALYALSEVNETARYAIRDAMPGGRDRWKVEEQAWLCAMWDSTKFEHRGVDRVGFGKSPYHGAVRVSLRHRAARWEFDLISVHLRPNTAYPATWSDAQKRDEKVDDLRSAVADLRRPGMPTIIAGDMNTSWAEKALPGFDRGTPNVDTMTGAGDQRVDAVFYAGGFVSRGHSLIQPKQDGKTVSDHRAWVWNGTFGFGTS